MPFASSGRASRTRHPSPRSNDVAVAQSPRDTRTPSSLTPGAVDTFEGHARIRPLRHRPRPLRDRLGRARHRRRRARPDDEATLRRLRRALPDAAEAIPPPGVAAAIAAIARLLDGERDDLGSVVLDMHDVPDFHRRVYDVARTIPPGETLSYGEVAARLGEPGAAQAVGRALGRNPFPIVVPLPSRARRERRAARLLGAGWHRDEAPHARDRGRRRADAVLGR